jgi:hypothetical protein
MNSTYTDAFGARQGGNVHAIFYSDLEQLTCASLRLAILLSSNHFSIFYHSLVQALFDLSLPLYSRNCPNVDNGRTMLAYTAPNCAQFLLLTSPLFSQNLPISLTCTLINNMSYPTNKQTSSQPAQQQTAAQQYPSGAPSSTSIHQDQPSGAQQKPGFAHEQQQQQQQQQPIGMQQQKSGLPQQQQFSGQQTGAPQGFQQSGGQQPYGMQQKSGLGQEQQPYGQQTGATQGSQQSGQQHYGQTGGTEGFRQTGMTGTSSAADDPYKLQGKEHEKQSHRLQEEGARASKVQNQSAMSDPNATFGTKVSATAHAAKDWMSEKKHGAQASHIEKKHGDQPHQSGATQSQQSQQGAYTAPK